MENFGEHRESWRFTSEKIRPSGTVVIIDYGKHVVSVTDRRVSIRSPKVDMDKVKRSSGSSVAGRKR